MSCELMSDRLCPWEAHSPLPVWHPKDLGRGWGGRGLLFTPLCLCNMCYQKATSDSPKHKLGSFLLENLEGLPNAYDRKGLVEQVPGYIRTLAPATPSCFLWPEHLSLLHWANREGVDTMGLAAKPPGFQSSSLGKSY